MKEKNEKTRNEEEKGALLEFPSRFSRGSRVFAFSLRQQGAGNTGAITSVN